MICIRYFYFFAVLSTVFYFSFELESSPIQENKKSQSTKTSKISLQSTPYQGYITGVGVRIRKDPNTKSQILGTVSLGDEVEVLSRSKKEVKVGNDSAYWLKIRNNKTVGWVFGSFLLRGGQYDEWVPLAWEIRERLKSPVDLSEAMEIANRWKNLEIKAKDPVSKVSFHYFQCLTIQTVFNSMTPDIDTNPPKNFQNWLKTLDTDLYYYHELAAIYQLKADHLWKLAENNPNHPLVEEIRYTASSLLLGGECEGYVPCHISTLILTDLEYLRFHPNGKYSRQILESVKTSFLAFNENYYYPTKSEVDEYKMYLQLIFDTRNIVKNTKGSDRDIILKRLQELEDQKLNDNKNTDKEN